MDALQPDGHALLPCRFHGRPHVQSHVVANDAEQVQIGFPSLGCQIRPNLSTELDNPVIVVDHDRGRRILRQQQRSTCLCSGPGAPSPRDFRFALRDARPAEHRKGGHARGQFEAGMNRHRFPQVDAVLGIEGRKEINHVAGSFRFAERQEAIRL